MRYNNAFIVIFVIIFNLIGFSVYGADWKYMGGFFVTPKEEVISFYDAQSVESSANGIVKVWTKHITKTEFNRIIKKQEKQIIDRSAKKLASNYFPPYTLFTHDDVTVNNAIDIISWEEVANHQETKPRLKVYFEINCKEHKLRNLSVIDYKNDPQPKSISKPSEWSYISPESNGETLQNILCGQ